MYHIHAATTWSTIEVESAKVGLNDSTVTRFSQSGGNTAAAGHTSWIQMKPSKATPRQTKSRTSTAENQISSHKRLQRGMQPKYLSTFMFSHEKQMRICIFFPRCLRAKFSNHVVCTQTAPENFGNIRSCVTLTHVEHSTRSSFGVQSFQVVVEEFRRQFTVS